MADESLTLGRLDDQIRWYSREAGACQRFYTRAKVLEIVIAAFIPLGSVIKLAEGPVIIGSLGVVITVIEGILHLNQYQQKWISFRGTAEALKHEKYLYLASAGPYANAANAPAVLAERIEALMSQENVQWASTQLSTAVTATTSRTGTGTSSESG